ncbi:hypothetical protein [Fretibacter rubidus]|uniref:hypothetical protein n=1 Tax=Fretibacter rubidus TaxID=570162 RepID=UPI00352BCF70
MAKAKTETVDTKTLNIGQTLRKGTLAYLGLYGTAYARAKTRFDQVKSSTDGLFDTLVVRGEVIEAKAAQSLKTAQSKVSATYTTSAAKVRDVMPTASNDRVSELEAEVEALHTKIAKMAKKSAAKPAKKAAASMKTEKSTKAA